MDKVKSKPISVKNAEGYEWMEIAKCVFYTYYNSLLSANEKIMKNFRDIPGYENKYQINIAWEIYSLPKKTHNWKIIKGSLDKDWYLLCNLYKLSSKKTYKIHRLVMLTFKWESNLEVNHKNWIKHDNRLENLEYCTGSENKIHSCSVLWNNNKKVWQYKNGILIKVWKTIKSASEWLQIQSSHISTVCIWKRKTTGGFNWKYL